MCGKRFLLCFVSKLQYFGVAGKNTDVNDRRCQGGVVLGSCGVAVFTRV